MTLHWVLTAVPRQISFLNAKVETREALGQRADAWWELRYSAVRLRLSKAGEEGPCRTNPPEAVE